MKFGVNPDNGLTHSNKMSILAKLQPYINFKSIVPIEILRLLPDGVPPRKEWVNAIKIVLNPDNRVGASRRLVEYWTIRGWSFEDAKSKISAIQRKLLPSCPEHYDGMNLSESEILLRISTAQSIAATSFHKNRDDLEFRHTNTFCNLLSEEQSRRGKIFSEKVKSGEILHNLSKDYYKHKYGNSWKAHYSKFQEYRMSCCSYRSKSEDEFISRIVDEFESEKQYYGDNQYGIMGDDGYCKYDYVNLDRMVVVEFNGDYWHSNEKTKLKDLYKRNIVESLGFTLIVVWWSDYISDKELTVKQCIEKIYESSKSNPNR